MGGDRMSWGTKLGKAIIDGYKESQCKEKENKEQEREKESFWSTKNLFGEGVDMWLKNRD